MPFGLFGSASDSRSETTNIRRENITSANVNLEPGDVEGNLYSTGISGVSAAEGADVTIETTDQGAVGRSFDFADNAAGRSFDFADNTVGRAFELVNRSGKRVMETAGAAAQQASNNMQAAVRAVRETVTEQNETQNVIRGVAVIGGILAVTLIAINWRK